MIFCFFFQGKFWGFPSFQSGNTAGATPSDFSVDLVNFRLISSSDLVIFSKCELKKIDCLFSDFSNF